MAQEINFQAASFKAEDGYWWEEDFCTGKLVDLPDWSKDSGMPSTSEHIQHTLHITDEASSEPANTDILAQRVVVSRVSSLVNLSINKIMSVSENQAIQVPPGLVPLLNRHRERVKLEKLQLTWLLNELINREKTVHVHLRSCSKHSPQNQDKFFFRGCRPTWESDLDARQHLYYGYTFLNNYDKETCLYLPVAVEGREGSDWCIAALAHTIQLMLPQRLSLEQSDSHIAGQEPVSKSLEEALEASIIIVSRALSKVCPKLVKYCFEPALAYVWWSRGDLSKAKEAFLRIAEQIPSDIESDPLQVNEEGDEVTEWITQRALYLNETGRLHSFYGQPELAVKYYQEAASLYSECVPRYAVDCLVQSLVLIATAYDQGLMDSTLALRAADSWSTLTVRPDINPSIVQMAVESFLHCHTGCLSTHRDCTDNQTTEWLQEGKDLLKRLVVWAPQVNLHLSFVHAMLGNDTEAEDSYMNYVQQYASIHPGLQQQIPGAVSVFVGSKIKPHPWWMFSDWQMTSNANKSGKPREANSLHLRALPLVWRRQFRYCSCNTKDEREDGLFRIGWWGASYSQVAELQDNDLSLYLNKDGLLGGCLTQNLPPVRPVLLDPYTGSICVPEQYHEQETLPWSNSHVSRRYNLISYTLSFDTFIPTPVHVYSSYTGTVVSFLTWHQNKVDEGETVHERPLDLQETLATHVVLSYSNRDSGTHTLSLVEPVIESKKMIILEQLKMDGYSEDPQVMEDATDFLDFCTNASKKMQYSILKTALYGESRERLTLLSIKRQLGKTPGKSVGSKPLTKKVKKDIKDYGPFELEPQDIVLNRVMLIGQSTAVLALHTDKQGVFGYHYVNDGDTLVFVDCTSPETFSNPVIQRPSHPNASWHLPSKDDYVDKSAEMFIAVESVRSEDRLVIFDAKGTVLQRHVWKNEAAIVVVSSCPIPDNDTENTDMVLNNNQVKSRLKLMSTNGTIQFQTKPLGRIERFLLVESMVFVSLRDRILVLESTTLEPIEIIHREASTTTEQPGLPFESTGVLLTGVRSFLKVLSVNKLSTSPSDQADECIQVILGVANHVFVLQRAKHTTQGMAEYSVNTRSSPLSIVAKILVPGVPTEACYLSQLDGFVVTVSLFEDREQMPLYRENLYWFDINGCIQGIHPFIGPGPHCLFASNLKRTPPDVKEAQELANGKKGRSCESGGMQEKQWHIFFADGLGALCCIKL